jgi:AcrR family transcriptional regulator
MAARLGTSPRILMFHFKSKEGLFQEVLQELHSRLRSSFFGNEFERVQYTIGCAAETLLALGDQKGELPLSATRL